MINIRPIEADSNYCHCNGINSPCRFCFYGACSKCYQEEGDCYCECPAEEVED